MRGGGRRAIGDSPSTWSSGDSYEAYVGRWSRLVAREFVAWLAVPADRRWLDVGCGTGALTQAILAGADPREVVGIDPSTAFVGAAAERVADARASFLVGDAQALPADKAGFDAVVSGLVLNFVPQPEIAVVEMVRVVRPKGTVAAYVWDYLDGMQLMRHFWDVAAELFDEARALDEGVRFAAFDLPRLEALFATALSDVEGRDFVVPTEFSSFHDYWRPFLGGTGPAPQFATSLSAADRARLREALRARLPIAADGSIRLTARAWAVRGSRRAA